MIDRRLSPTLSRRLNETPAVVLLGPRQAGKTTLLVNGNYTSPSGGSVIVVSQEADALRDRLEGYGPDHTVEANDMIAFHSLIRG